MKYPDTKSVQVSLRVVMILCLVMAFLTVGGCVTMAEYAGREATGILMLITSVAFAITLGIAAAALVAEWWIGQNGPWQDPQAQQAQQAPSKPPQAPEEATPRRTRPEAADRQRPPERPQQ